MKKVFKRSLLFVSLGFVALLGIYLIKRLDKGPTVFLSFPRPLAVVFADGERNFSFLLYSNVKNCEYLKAQNIHKTELCENEQIILLELRAIKQRGAVEIEGERYYEYEFIVDLPLKTPLLLLSTATAVLTYANGQTMRFPLGSAAFLVDNSRKAFLVNQLKGIVLPGDQAGLGGVIITLTNLEEADVVLERLTLISGSAQVNHQQMKELESSDFSHTTPISAIIEEDFDYQRQYPKVHCDELFETGVRRIFFIPFSYLTNLPLNEVGFVLYYRCNGVNHQQIIKPVMLYQSSQISPQERIIYDTNLYQQFIQVLR